MSANIFCYFNANDWRPMGMPNSYWSGRGAAGTSESSQTRNAMVSLGRARLNSIRFRDLAAPLPMLVNDQTP